MTERTQGAPATLSTVLVTGATGMLGSHIVDRLVDRGIAVIAVDRAAPEPGYAWRAVDEGRQIDAVETVVADITDSARMRTLIERADAIVHVAAVLSKAAGDAPGPIMTVNVAATHALFEAAAAGRKKVVFASSGSVYGPNRPAVEGAPPRAFVEADPSPDLGFYALSKHINELHAAAFGRSAGLDWVALRLGTLLGSRLRMGLTSRFLLSVLDDADIGRPPRVDGDPDSGLDWVHVEDAAECFVRAVAGDVTGMAINAATGVPSRLEVVLQQLLSLYDAPTEIDWTGPRQPTGGFSSARYYRSDLAAEVLGFRPSGELTVGLKSFIQWRRARKAG